MRGEKRKGGGEEVKEKNREHVHKTSSVRGKAKEEDRNKKEGTRDDHEKRGTTCQPRKHEPSL